MGGIMAAKKPDDLELATTCGEMCEIVRRKPTVLRDPIKIRYIMDITLFDSGDFDIDFSFRNEEKIKHDLAITDSVHLMESKARIKGAFSEKLIKDDQFLKNWLRDFFSIHFEVHPLDLLIRLNYEENNYPETVFITFDVERDKLMDDLATIDESMLGYLTVKCLI